MKGRARLASFGMVVAFASIGPTVGDCGRFLATVPGYGILCNAACPMSAVASPASLAADGRAY